MALRFRRVRYVLLAVLLFFVFTHVLRQRAADGPVSEFLHLERFMNDASLGNDITATPSSFKWDTVSFAYPPNTDATLPKRDLNRALPPVQHRFPTETKAAAELRNRRRDEVRDLFKKNWKSYKAYAWKKDALKPLTAGFVDQFSGWAATLIDSLDTLWIMGLRDDFYEAVAAVASIDFGSSTSGRVNMFETNIRYLGGLLAAYDLSHHKALLTKAKEVGDLLFAGFNTPNHMPVDFIDFRRAKEGTGLEVEGSVVSASPGTLSLEFTRLSQLTGDSKYYAVAQQVMDVFYRDQNNTQLPGMWPMMVSMSRKDVTTGYQFTVGGCADSLYEYLPKQHALLGGADATYETMSRAFFETAKKHMFFRPMVPDNADVLIAGNVDVLDGGVPVLDPESQHLSCFIGGLYALGGRLFSNAEYVEVGEKLTRGCIYAYKAMPTGMMPERFNMIKCPDANNCKWDESLWDSEKVKRSEYKSHLPKGFTTAKDPRYILRPEAIESVFIAYRVTGKQEYQEAAWDMFDAIAKGTRTEYANAAVLDVTQKAEQLPQEDYMESFWLAETLKYFYLVFSPPDLISLDEFVLNTEAHPFRR